mmetsp:Transcript_44264/g.42964  ORF Transcript_44264/g.42964 Transcript_44264/m.42964 type:complete len:143 (-) Transcript_44264:362-790(-)
MHKGAGKKNDEKEGSQRFNEELQSVKSFRSKGSHVISNRFKQERVPHQNKFLNNSNNLNQDFSNVQMRMSHHKPNQSFYDKMSDKLVRNNSHLTKSFNYSGEKEGQNMADLNRVNPRYMRNINAMESIRAKIINRIDNLSPN